MTLEIMIMKLLAEGYSIVIEHGTEQDWDKNRFPFKIAIKQNDQPVFHKDSHKLETLLGQAVRELLV